MKTGTYSLYLHSHMEKSDFFETGCSLLAPYFTLYRYLEFTNETLTILEILREYVCTCKKMRMRLQK